MSERIITLFGEEIIPEHIKAVGRSRAKKKSDDKKDDAGDDSATEDAENEPEQEKPAPVKKAPKKSAAKATAEDKETPAASHNEQQAAEADEETEKVKEKKPNLPEDWHGDKQYYSIGEVAELFKVKTSHIRFWTNEFKIKVRTTRKGDRLYTAEQIKEIRTIHHLVKERGFTLAGARAKLKSPDNLDVQTLDLKQQLLQLRNKLMAIKNQLK